MKRQIVLRELYDSIVAGSVAEQLQKMLLGKMAKTADEDLQDKRKVAVSGLVSLFRGERLLDKRLDDFSRIAAGWEKELEQGIVYRQWLPDQAPSWAALFVADIERLLRKGRLYKVWLESHAGSTAGCTWAPVLTGGFLQHLMRDTGGPKYEKYPDANVGRTWFTALISCSGSRLEIKNICASSSQLLYNRKLHKDRKDRCKFPEEIYVGATIKDKDKICLNCWKGADQCPLSRHLRTYAVKDWCRNTKGGHHRANIVADGYCFQCVNTGNFEEA
jgi:hypothetical protein